MEKGKLMLPPTDLEICHYTFAVEKRVFIIVQVAYPDHLRRIVDVLASAVHTGRPQILHPSSGLQEGMYKGVSIDGRVAACNLTE
jgi:hypothetical protein